MPARHDCGESLYLDAFAGVSGDMFVGGLLDLGLPLAVLEGVVADLGLAGTRLAAGKVRRGAIAATRFSVECPSAEPERRLADILALLDRSGLPARVREQSARIFSLLARAEAKVHGCAVEAVHFHEVGAVDAIVDVVGAVAGLQWLGVERVIASPLPLSGGVVRSEHGLLPLPAPATLELLKGAPVRGGDGEGETVTPTGAALVSALAESFGGLPAMTIAAVGHGAGARELTAGLPNVLRMVLGRVEPVREAGEVEVIETNLDDWAPEGAPLLFERLFFAGALDVTLSPLTMKKGRPGLLLTALASPDAALQVKRVIFSETTAIGLRYHRAARLTLPRQTGTVATSLGLVQVKRVETPAGASLRPEYEDCRRIAAERGIPLAEVYLAVARAREEDFIRAPEQGP